MRFALLRYPRSLRAISTTLIFVPRYNFETVLSAVFTIQIFAPSKAAPTGDLPVGKVPKFSPSLERSRVTVLSEKFVTQTLVPSKARATGP